MILVDTSVWVEFLKAKQPWLGERTRLLEEQEVLAADPVFGELLQGASNERELGIIPGYWRHLPKGTSKEMLHPIWRPATITTGREPVTPIDLALKSDGSLAPAR
jgi:hypothetical protein